MTEPELQLRKGGAIEVRGTGLDALGSGVAEVGGRSLRVAGLLPGERARVRIDDLARNSNKAYGHLLELLGRHPARRAPACLQHRDPLARSGTGTCGGCPLMHVEVAAQRELKRARLRELGLELAADALIGGDEWGYRWSTKRVVGGRVGALVLGSRRADPLAHPGQLADMQGCLVDHPAIERVFGHLVRIANELEIRSWRAPTRDVPASGDLRHVWAKTDGHRVLLTLITSPDASGDADASDAAARLPARLMAAAPELVGVAWSVQTEQGNAMRGREPLVLAGKGALALELAGVRVELGPLGFLQPNPTIAAQAYLELVEAERASLVWDLYAGAGVTTALLRERHDRVVPCESYEESARALGVAPSSVEDFLRDHAGEVPGLIVANPPRAGLGELACARLVELGAARVHIMSCNPDTLAQDLARLAPRYELERLRGYDTLPQTAHLELVARLRRIR